MDLSSIRRNIEAGVIRSTPEYQRDLMLMFFNARMYNKPGDVVHDEAVIMEKETLELIQVFSFFLNFLTIFLGCIDLEVRYIYQYLPRVVMRPCRQ